MDMKKAQGRSAPVQRTLSAGTGCVLLLAVLAAAVSATQQASAQSVIGGFGISTVAGGGTAPATCSGSTDAYGDGCLATQATLNSPQRVAFDGAGNMYIADGSNNRIRMISAATGIITTVVGGGTAPSTCTGSIDAYGDGCAPTQAVLNGPQGMLFDQQGNLYVVDRGNYAIRKVTNPSTGTGVITTIVGAVGTGNGCQKSATTTLLKADIDPKEIAFDLAGNLYISQNNDSCWGVVMVSNTSGTPTVFTPGTLSPFIGQFSCGTPTGIPGPASGAVTCSVDGVTADKLNNLYLTLSSQYMIVKATNVSQGTATPLSIVGGTVNVPGFTGDGGPATAAEIHPETSVLDAYSNIFVADGANNRVREIIAATGEIITVAGGGTSPATCAGSTDSIGDGCAATLATLNTTTGPSIGLAFDPSGNLYIADAGNNRIRKLTAATNFTLPSTAVKSSVTATAYVETTNATTTSVTAAVSSPSGDFAVTTPLPACTVVGTSTAPVGYSCAVPITYTPKLPGQRSEPLTVTAGSNSYTFEVTGVGTAPVAGFVSPPIASLTATASLLKAPTASAVDTDGDLYIADTGNNLVRKVTAAGVASVVSTGSTTLNGPSGVAVDGSGNLYIADTGNNVVRMLTPSGTLSTIAGTGTAKYTGDNGLATAATLNAPTGLAVDPYGILYIADTGNNVVRKVVGGVIWTVAGSGTSPSSCSGSTDTYGDGCVATQATLKAPTAVAVDPSRNLYIADTGDDVVRKVSYSTGVISVLAGVEGVPGYGGDGLVGTSALLNAPGGITVDAAGDLYIADTGNDVVRAIYGNGLISTLAGISGVATYTGDGGSAAAATLKTPASVSVGGADIVYVVDTGNNAVRTLTMTSTVPLAFPDTAINTTSNPLTTIVENLGNSALTFSGLSFPTYFSQQPTTVSSGVNCGTTASSGTVSSLAAGGGCYLATVFKPTVIGSESGVISITDNTGNVASSIQTVAVSGKSVAALGAVTVSVPTVTYGTASLMTITVAGSGTYPTPTGTVTYTLDNGAPSAAETLTSGAYGPVSLGTLNAGSHTVTVSYSGDLNYGRSTVTTTFTVNGLAVTVGVTEAPANPTYGASITATVTLTATASNTPISGQVTYLLDASTTPFPLTITNGTGTIALGNSLSVACHTLAVSYAGGTQYGSATQTLNFCVTADATTTTLVGPTNPVYTGIPANFTATVTAVGTNAASAAGGTVLFQIGTVVICTSTVSSTGTATCSYSFGTAPFATFGTFSVTANYQASADLLASSSAAVSVVYNPPATTATTLTGPASGTTGYSATFTATVTTTGVGLSTSGGTVLFQVGSSTLCTSTVSSTGVATCSSTIGTAPFSTVGSYTLTATYQATPDLQASTSAPLTVLYSTVPDFTIIPETPAVGATPAKTITSVMITPGSAGAGIWVVVQGNDYSASNATAFPGYSGTVNLSCSGMPAFMGCSFTPTAVTIATTSYPSSFPTITSFTISVFSTQSRLSPSPFGSQGRASIVAASLFFPALVLAGWIGRKRKLLSSKLRGGLLLVALLLSLGGFAGISGCGFNQNGVAPGTYQLNIVGTDTANNVVRSTPLSVTVTQ